MKILSIPAIVLLLSLTITSCSKDQKYVNWFGDGAWTLASATLNGEDYDPGGTYDRVISYDKCKLADADCSGSEQSTFDRGYGAPISIGYSFLYRVHDKGTKITYTTLSTTTDGVTEDCTTDCVSTWDILEMEKTRHVIRWEDSDGDVWIMTFAKI